MKESEDNDRKNHEKQIPRLKVFCHHPVKGKLVDIKLFVMPDITWAEAMEQAYKKFGLENVVNLDQCRLVSYEHSIDLIECSYDDREQESVASIWQDQHRYDLLLEIRRKDQKFETFLPGGEYAYAHTASCDICAHGAQLISHAVAIQTGDEFFIMLSCRSCNEGICHRRS